MSLVDVKERGERRRRDARQRDRKVSLTSLVLILGVAAVAWTAVWQGLQFTQVRMAYDAARQDQQKLRSDIDALRIQLQGNASVAQMEPIAREKFGLVDPPSEDLHLVTFNDAAPAPSLLDRAVPAALASPKAK